MPTPELGTLPGLRSRFKKAWMPAPQKVSRWSAILRDTLQLASWVMKPPTPQTPSNPEKIESSKTRSFGGGGVSITQNASGAPSK
eukprot:2490688-Amphidinium_carterae.1